MRVTEVERGAIHTDRGKGGQSGKGTDIFNDGREDVAIGQSLRLQSFQSQSKSISSAPDHDRSERNSNVENVSTEAARRLRKETDKDGSDGDGNISNSSLFV